MGDYARLTLLAWPYPGRYELPRPVLEELETHDALPYRDQATAEDYLGDAGAVVLGGDERSGPILAVVDERAGHGIAAWSGRSRAPACMCSPATRPVRASAPAGSTTRRAATAAGQSDAAAPAT